MSLERLLHYVSLDGAGGVEQQFVEFLRVAREQIEARHAVVACGRRVHPMIRARLDDAHVSLCFEKYIGPVKLPKWPPGVRARRQRTIVSRQRPDVVVIWNRLRDSLDTLAAAGAERCIYWERGASWFAGDSPAKRAFLAEVPAAICNSRAARRMLELRWGYTGQTRIIHNALRPSLMPACPPQPRRLSSHGAVRLGVVARLEPIKGVAIAIHALAALRAQDVDATLRVAGEGPETQRLRALVDRLGLAEHVVFEGLVHDMPAFYQRIDLLVHPALREPFGQIVVEANAYGVPAVVTAVDGLVEVVADGETGLCVAPTLSLAEYAELGAGTHDLPPFVYDPVRDVIDAPKAVDPHALAQAVRRAVDDEIGYARMSAAAIDIVRRRFVFDDHVHDALASIDAFTQFGCLDPGMRA